MVTSTIASASLLLKQKCRGHRIIAALPGLFVGDDDLLLRRIDDEYSQQPSRLRRAALALTLWWSPGTSVQLSPAL